MRAVIQRVTKASVTVNDELVSSIGRGLCVLVGISRNDNEKDIDYIVRKLLNLRLWSDASGKRWAHSLSAQKLEVLCVSQVTLYHQLKGNAPDFHQAMPAPDSKAFFAKFISQLKTEYTLQLVKEGSFGKYKQVHIQGDGPVTIQLESPPTTIRGTNNKNKTTAQAKPQNFELQASGDSNISARNNQCVFKSE